MSGAPVIPGHRRGVVDRKRLHSACAFHWMRTTSPQPLYFHGSVHSHEGGRVMHHRARSVVGLALEGI
jgi:hypothetical protein